jgi:hypothetical protein
MTGKDDFLAQLEDYLDNAEGSTILPHAVRDAVRVELPSTRQVGPLRGPMRIFAMATQLPRSSRYGLAAAVVAIALVGGASFLVGSNHATTPPGSSQPASSPSAATAVLDDLIAAWNAGNTQEAAALYWSAQPYVRLMVNNGTVTTLTSTADITSAVNTWHSQGAVITRTGDVLTQGSYVATTVTWTSSQGTFNGAEVLHLDGNGLVLGEYRMGATSAVAPGTAAGADVVKALTDAIHNPMKAISLRFGAATPDAFATDTKVWQFEGDVSGDVAADGQSALAGPLNFYQAKDSYVHAVTTQGPFVLYSATAGDQGFNILWLTGDGLIQYSWDIRAPITTGG